MAYRKAHLRHILRTEGLLPSSRVAARDGYKLDVSYEVVTPESAEYGDAEDRGWKIQNDYFDTLEELIDSLAYDHTWLEWSSSSPDGKRDWIISQAEEDYSSGANTSYHAFVTRADKKPLSKGELQQIHKGLRLMGRI
jgi:hypothetical protein